MGRLTKVIIFTISILFIASGCSFDNENERESNIKLDEQKNITEEESPAWTLEGVDISEDNLVGKIEILDDVWRKYTNTELGFSVEYPKITQGKYVYPVENGNVFYLASIRYKEDIEENYFDESNFDKSRTGAYAFHFEDALSRNEVQEFVHKKYYSSCDISEFRKSLQAGVFDIVISNENFDMEDPNGCNINYMTVVKYDENKGRIVSWDIGQEFTFWLEGEPVDDRVNESFTFL